MKLQLLPIWRLTNLTLHNYESTFRDYTCGLSCSAMHSIHAECPKAKNITVASHSVYNSNLNIAYVILWLKWLILSIEIADHMFSSQNVRIFGNKYINIDYFRPYSFFWLPIYSVRRHIFVIENICFFHL